MRNNGGPRWKKMMKSGSLNSLNLEHFPPFPDHRQSQTLLLKKPISAATDEPPNYMKSTSSSHQRRLSLDESCYLKLATSMSCSPKMPIMKKVPENQWYGTSIKACRYPSCSLNSSHQDNLLHPPKCFLTTQKIEKVKLQGHDHFNREISSELAGQMKEQEEAIEVKHVLVE